MEGEKSQQQEPEMTKCDEPSTSIDLLRKCPPGENIAICEPDRKSSTTVHTVYKGELKEKESPVVAPSESSQVTTLSTEEIAGPSTIAPSESAVVKPGPAISRPSSSASLPAENKRVVHNSSDIFSLRSSGERPQKEQMIFSVSGAPSRKLYRRHLEATADSGIFSTSLSQSQTATTPERVHQPPRDKASNSSMNRNPLTGAGMESADDHKYKGNGRKDGNPVLGLGYTDSTVCPSSTRIPPGGYSQGLW